MDTVVIGAGWAGLGVSYELTRRGIPHIVLERARIGETWRTQRWDTFRLNTTTADTLMPGETYDGPDPDGALTQTEFIALLEDYARRHKLPVEEGRAVTALSADANGGFVVEAGGPAMRARNVVIASGSLNRPLPRPEWAAPLPLPQIDACDYRSAGSLPAGPVLVVGSGQSGAQIAYDLASAGKSVYLSTGRVGRLIRRYRDKDTLRWLDDSGFMDVTRAELIAAAPDGRLPGRGVIGATRTLSLQFLSAEGVMLAGRLTGLSGGRMLTFRDDVAANVLLGDEASARVKHWIDAYIERSGIDAPPAEEDPAETVAPRLPDPPVLALEASSLGCIVWCTGFRGDYGYVDIAGVLDGSGQPIHVDGAGTVPGLYFAGLDFGITRKSGTIRAVNEESTRFATLIAERLAADR
ncbi:NAD(P)/FAD-dependent oxidoreductase [Mesorhizobium sp. LHD-90]|uniref:flavin-containing monooxygenase n=1 Tax=Mesorhizobium sp. LHD-90 TaxID=3071414 RepID=UPI0027DEF4A0|nr:NAD(P)/FAD-dependent oxidoreductase [Mesorhizobium sp. LHD-90]MDQ6436475.1 NAD(P)/FAD-dependent oxidoreductase [Mesorhizobium sp. LHD-90]